MYFLVKIPDDNYNSPGLVLGVGPSLRNQYSGHRNEKDFKPSKFRTKDAAQKAIKRHLAWYPHGLAEDAIAVRVRG